MFKKLLSLFCLCSLSLSALQSFPSEFYVKERWIAATTTFDIESDEFKLGTVHRKFFSWTPEYHLKDMNGEFQAKAKMRFWSFQTIFDVEDGQGKPLGTVEQNLTWFFPSFEIVSPTHQRLAKAELNFWGTKYTITDRNDDHVIALLTRPFFQFFKNTWTVTIVDPKAIDEKAINPNLFLVLIAFQVDSEYWRAHQNNNNTLTINDTVEDTQQELMKELEEKGKNLPDVEPKEEDLVFVETLSEENKGESKTEELFLQTFRTLMKKLDSNELTIAQKVGLYRMLQNRLHSL